jgi:hypothetical protein
MIDQLTFHPVAQRRSAPEGANEFVCLIDGHQNLQLSESRIAAIRQFVAISPISTHHRPNSAYS